MQPKNSHWIQRAWERRGLSGKIAWLLLLPFSWLFFVGVCIRNLLFSLNWRRALTLERAVISVGNLTVGGTGKTPSCLWLSQELERRGLKVAVLSRGYKRNAVEPIILCPSANGSSFSEDAAAAAGDEPFMMARLYGQTVGVGRERYRVAQELLKKSAVDVLILDDGFQHRQLRRDVDLVLLGDDSTGSLLPSGPFREPRNALRRADYLLLTGAREKWKPFVDSVERGTCFAGSLEAVALVSYESNLWKEYPLTLLYRSRILAVTGIARPQGLYRFIRDYEGEIVDILEFPDHHPYSSSDWQQINRAARAVDLIVTTEKDIVKLVRFPFARDKLLALRVAMRVENGPALVEAMLQRIQKKLKRPTGAPGSMKERTKAAAVFLDRDGTILRDVGYLCSQEQIEILPGVPEAIRLLKEKGYKIVVVTNQSAVARGRLSEKQLKQIHEEVRAQLARAGATLDAVYYCPHHPSEGVTAYRVLCDCRKPNTGMIRRASEELGLEPARSYVVGDQATDMELAARVGATGVWICDSAKAQKDVAGGTRVARDLWDAAQWIVVNS